MIDGGQNTFEASITRRTGLKFVAGAVAMLVSVSAGLMALAQQQPTPDAAVFEMLPDWSHAGIDAPMAISDLVTLKEAAIRFLKRNESGDLQGIEKELQEYIQRCCQQGSAFDVKKASGLYLLFRVLFELPDITGANEAWNFGGWFSAEDQRALKEKLEADDFHPAWPVYLARISNKLYVRSNTSPLSADAALGYRPLEEYRFLRSKYRFRKADEIVKMEFIFVAGK